MPTVADVEPLQELLHSIEPGAPLVHGALTVIPLLTPSSEEVDWVTLDEAGDDVVVTEAAGGASVPTLQVSNAGDRPLLLLEGEELIGEPCPEHHRPRGSALDGDHPGQLR